MMKVWAHVDISEADRERLRRGIEQAGGEWIEGTEVVGEGPTIAYGQPPVDVMLRTGTLRWIQVDTAGFERYDREDVRDWLRAGGRQMTNSSHVYADPCAEHVVAMIFSLARQLPRAWEIQRGDRSWPMMALRADSFLLRGQSAVLLGYGAIGERVAELLAPLGMRLTGYRRRPTGDEPIPMVDAQGLGRACAEADHVINLLPASPSTEKFCDRAFFQGLRRGSRFYNIGRGKTVDQEALLEALVEGPLAAAFLDVTDPEPLPPDHPLWLLPNCFLTPHTAGGHHRERDSHLVHFLDNFGRFQRGEPLRDLILRERP
jgi:phosphoglycerate dehydrogenase-like enzyme